MKRKASNRGEWLPTPMSVYIDEIIEEENRAMEAQKIMATHFTNVKIRAMHNDTQMNVEFDIMEASISEVKAALAELIANGFVRPISNAAPKQDNVNKIGVVTSVTKKEGKEQWDVVVLLDDKSGEQRIVSFSAKEYRKGDIVRIEKNVKGYAVGVILDDNERPTRTDEMKF